MFMKVDKVKKQYAEYSYIFFFCRCRNFILYFPFTYEEVFEGKTVAREKDIMCEPHLKLINKGFNLRIYFQWKDEEVGRREKVLVGRIGGHPY